MMAQKIKDARKYKMPLLIAIYVTGVALVIFMLNYAWDSDVGVAIRLLIVIGLVAFIMAKGFNNNTLRKRSAKK